MKYLVAEFKIECQDGMIQIARDLLTDALGEAGFETFEDTEDGIKGYVQESLFDENAMNDVISNFMLPDVTINANIQEAEYKNWNEEWEEAGFERININDSITIYDARHDDGNGIASGISIGIETKQAFGTGTHETTRMIVSTLLNIDIKGKRVLDCGCGTGILGIAASKLGASEVVGYDIDEWSSENAIHNAELNGVGNMKVMLGDASVLKSVEGKFDVVLANINRNILLADMPAFVSVMADDSLLILSGFYASDVDLLIEKASSLGLSKIDSKSDSEWTCLVLKK
ncbi:MAG: 50S ribosomal protein L11 methyltransferase [Prevotella sp.]|nr:50S ribosomal protein L11 methyltransferase [Prevotella sp.]MDY4150380.1 50S ribosomal protein L11 methyltransferase [Prevotella sp.]